MSNRSVVTHMNMHTTGLKVFTRPLLKNSLHLSYVTVYLSTLSVSPSPSLLSPYLSLSISLPHLGITKRSKDTVVAEEAVVKAILVANQLVFLQGHTPGKVRHLEPQLFLPQL